MVSIPGEVAGAALIAPSYHITVKALDDKSYFSNVRAVEQAITHLLAHQYRLPHTVISDYIYRVRLLKLIEAAAENEDKIINTARDIRNLGRQRGERVPNDKEARAMACIHFTEGE
jgi:signal transduction histidine kinase